MNSSTELAADPLAPPTAVEPAVRASRLGAAAASVRRLVRHAGARALVGTVGTQLGLFGIFTIQGVLLARLLGPTGRGQYGTAVFYPQLLMYVGLLGTLLAIARRAAQPSTNPAALRQAALRSGMATGVLTVVVVLALSLFGVPVEKRHLILYCALAALMIPAEQVRLAILSVDHGLGRFHRYNRQRIAAALVMPALLAICFVIGDVSLSTVLVAAVAAPAIGLAMLLWTTRRDMHAPADPSVRTLLREGLPFAQASLAADLLVRLDGLLILWLVSYETQGLYDAAVRAATLLIIVPNGLALFTFNLGARQDRVIGVGQALKIGGLLIAVQMACGVIFAFMLPYLIPLVFGQEFRGAIPLALALLPAYIVNGISLVSEGYLQGRHKAHIGVAARVVAAVALLAAAAYLFPRFRDQQGPLAALVSGTPAGQVGGTSLRALGIPLAACIGQLCGAVCVVSAALYDIRKNSRRLAATVIT